MATRLSDSDMAVAAAYASGATYRAPDRHQQGRPRARSIRAPITEEEGDLPNIDDLQIAAGAAAGKKDPVWPVLRKALGHEDIPDEESEEEGTKDEVSSERGDEEMAHASSEDKEEEGGTEEETSEAESSDTSSSSSDEELIDAARAGLPARQTDQRMNIGLEVDASGYVKLQLAASSVKGEPADDMEELRAELDRMDHGGEDADDAHMEQGILPPVVELLDITVLPDDVILPVGRISAVIGPTIVVQAPENGRAVSEGTPLCLGDGHLVGRVEDVFGPVMEPLYSLRYACGPQMPSTIAVGAQMFCIQRLTEYILPQELYVKGYDKAEEDAESEVDEDNDVDEVEFSDDELETAWRRQQRAAEPSKRKMPQSGPASAMHNGGDRGRGRSQRGRYDGQARGQGRGRMQGRDGGEWGRGRGNRSGSRGRGDSPGGRAGRSAPYQNGQGQQGRSPNGTNQQSRGYGSVGEAQHQAGLQPVYADQQQNGHYLYPAQQQQLIGQIPYNAGLQQQQQQDHLLQQHQQQQPPFQQQPQAHALMPFLHSGMQNGQYMQPPPSGQPQSMSWAHQSNLQEGPMQGLASVPQQMQPSYAPMNTQSQPRNLQQQPGINPYMQHQSQQQHVMPAPYKRPQEHAMPPAYQAQHHYQAQLPQPQQQHQQHSQEQLHQHAGPIYHASSVSPQQPGQPQVDNQGFSQPPTPGVISSPATSAYLARLHGRPTRGSGR